jgi:hypothetical protein
MPRSRASRSPSMPGMMQGPTPVPKPPAMRASTPRLQPVAPKKAPTTAIPRGGLVAPATKALVRPKAPKMPMPSRANQGPGQQGAADRSLRSFGKQQRRVRMALNKQAGDPQYRTGLPQNPMAGNPASGALPQTPGASSVAIDQDATY